LDASADLLEFISLAVSFITFFFGLLLWVPDLSSGAKTIITFLIVASNIIFIIYAVWLTYKAAKAYYDKNGSFFRSNAKKESEEKQRQEKEKIEKEM
jgi:uncharacterized membrane protein